MNFIKPSFIRIAGRRSSSSIGRSSARLQSTIASTKPSAVPPQVPYDFKKAWLSDPSTYPLVVIMGSAITFMFAMGANALTYKDVQIDRTKRSKTIQDWGADKERHSVLEYLVHWCSFQKNMPEGLQLQAGCLFKAHVCT